MKSLILMTCAAVVLALAGIVTLFFPHEIFSLFSPAAHNGDVMLIQLLGAGFLGFAALDWFTRHSVIGGIFGRPVVITNYTHFVIGSLLIAREAFSNPVNAPVWIALVLYTLFAFSFAFLMYTLPPNVSVAR